jgi:ribosomal protein S18 acetylase RimI-like enzyme
MTTTVAPLKATDRAQWERLARGYKAFYNTATSAAEYEAAWSRLLVASGVHGLGAWQQGQMVGIAHYLFHTSTWAHSVCYLQDLYTAPEARGRGTARALINAVAAEAGRHGCARFYWLTQDSNTAARALYDRVARFNGFIRYDWPLGA